MAVVKIYGVRSIYSTEVIHWYRYRPDAEKDRDEGNAKYHCLEYRIVTAYYDDGNN